MPCDDVLSERAKKNQGARTDINILTNSSKGFNPINTRKEISKAGKVEFRSSILPSDPTRAGREVIPDSKALANLGQATPRGRA